MNENLGDLGVGDPAPPIVVVDRVRVLDRHPRLLGMEVIARMAGMVTGAHSIDDMDLLRHGGMGRPSVVGARTSANSTESAAAPKLTLVLDAGVAADPCAHGLVERIRAPPQPSRVLTFITRVEGGVEVVGHGFK